LPCHATVGGVAGLTETCDQEQAVAGRMATDGLLKTSARSIGPRANYPLISFVRFINSHFIRASENSASADLWPWLSVNGTLLVFLRVEKDPDKQARRQLLVP
jgi:hypothetical protein